MHAEDATTHYQWTQPARSPHIYYTHTFRILLLRHTSVHRYIGTLKWNSTRKLTQRASGGPGREGVDFQYTDV